MRTALAFNANLLSVRRKVKDKVKDKDKLTLDVKPANLLRVRRKVKDKDKDKLSLNVETAVAFDDDILGSSPKARINLLLA